MWGLIEGLWTIDVEYGIDYWLIETGDWGVEVETVSIGEQVGWGITWLGLGWFGY